MISEDEFIKRYCLKPEFIEPDSVQALHPYTMVEHIAASLKIAEKQTRSIYQELIKEYELFPKIKDAKNIDGDGI